MPAIFMALIALAAQTAPETFTSSLEARTPSGLAASSIRIQIERYTPDIHRTAMTDALRFGGYAGFLQALRKAPVVGYVELGDAKVALRWAREQPVSSGRAISLVTDAPVYFLGGGRAGGKPRSGFEIAIVQLTVDEVGRGTGTMAAAARIKPDGKGGVVLEDYADEPIRLTSVQR
jgi:hypothetical protein